MMHVPNTPNDTINWALTNHIKEIKTVDESDTHRQEIENNISVDKIDRLIELGKPLNLSVMNTGSRRLTKGWSSTRVFPAAAGSMLPKWQNHLGAFLVDLNTLHEE